MAVSRPADESAVATDLGAAVTRVCARVGDIKVAAMLVLADAAKDRGYGEAELSLLAFPPASTVAVIGDQPVILDRLAFPRYLLAWQVGVLRWSFPSSDASITYTAEEWAGAIRSRSRKPPRQPPIRDVVVFEKAALLALFGRLGLDLERHVRSLDTVVMRSWSATRAFQTLWQEIGGAGVSFCGSACCRCHHCAAVINALAWRLPGSLDAVKAALRVFAVWQRQGMLDAELKRRPLDQLLRALDITVELPQ